MNLAQTVFGIDFQNPVLLASGTCGYGAELDGFFDIDQLGGLVIKAVTADVRPGNPAPRVAEFTGGMINSVGLANPGPAVVRNEKLPWLARRLARARVLINIAGRSAAEYGEIIRFLDDAAGFHGYELNVSCPNVKEGGAIIATREDLLAEAVAAARRATKRPMSVKLAPNVPDVGRMAEICVAEGADALTLVNTMPGLLFDTETRRPVLGAGSGGVSGPALLPIGIHAVARARQRVAVPLIGVGGIRTAEDAVQYLLAGANLVQIGTASFADPRAAERVLSSLTGWGTAHGIGSVTELVGSGLLA
ncbi:MAG TPA: dihydroorotate dehydrogenase [Longimicrobiales bacterium]|nr:dihydroorotate dehydrogenase [Longimicrobiales bacterium]